MKKWIDSIQGNYVAIEQLAYWDDIYNVVERCGYKSVEELWDANPFISGSTNPEDFGIVTMEELVDAILPHYKEAVLFTEEINSEYDWNNAEFSVEGEMKMYHDIKVFIECIDNIHEILVSSNLNFELFGHDLWLSRNHHGAGFFDSPEIWGNEGCDMLQEIAGRQGELSAYVQDGLIYFE